MNRVDVVIPYYRQANGLARLWKTVLNNLKHINNVFIVNDELWTAKEKSAVLHNVLGVPPGVGERVRVPKIQRSTDSVAEGSFEVVPVEVFFLDHEHRGFGVTRSLNEGMARCTTDYVLVVPADGLLPTGFIEKKLKVAAEGPTFMLVSGPCHHVEPDSDPDSPKFLRTDGFEHLRETGRGQHAPWLYLRGINKLVSRKGWIECGGMDERFDECNYEDYEFVMRWLANFGPSSVAWEETPVLHQGDPRAGQEPKDPFPLKSAALLARQLIALRGGNVMLLTDVSSEWSPDFACIGEKPSAACDVVLPCQHPNWLLHCEVKLLRCNAFHQVLYPEHWFQSFAGTPGTWRWGPEALELSPVQQRDIPLFERYGYVIVGRDTVDRSVRAIRKDLA